MRKLFGIAWSFMSNSISRYKLYSFNVTISVVNILRFTNKIYISLFINLWKYCRPIHCSRANSFDGIYWNSFLMYERIRLFFIVNDMLFIIAYSVNDLAYRKIRRFRIYFIIHHKKAVQYLPWVTICNIRASSTL